MHLQNDEIWEEFKIYFEKTNPNFIESLLKINPKLSQRDLKYCSYIAAGLSTKEISNLIGLSIRTIETSRYRIKRKLNLSKEVNLISFIRNLKN